MEGTAIAPDEEDDPPPSSPGSWVHPDDLIDDRALAHEDDDAFRLRDVADEVVELSRAVPVPAALALYGSWGSGKSSLANLLKGRFAYETAIAFARFDAFKYAQVPLRRHFLSQVAAAFGIRDRKFSEGLYESTKTVRLRIPRDQWLILAGALVAALVAMTALAALGAVAVAAVSQIGRDASFWEEFKNALRASLPGVAIATPVVAAAVALVGKLSADTTTEAPSSEEQFEKLFKELVKEITAKKKCERIVIFIDELDRCSPAQVVSALETLRTFLEVEPCVFIVAADQQVLEHALDQSVRQATPFDPTNPYYSGGSAYLDKIFQYQLPLPPILPRRLSRFALDLIEDRQGIWARAGNRGELISVLVPTHVASPRRVKALLNSFALLYRLALKRADEGTIDTNIEVRAGEVAKLVCLRTEFPIFARDLQLSHRLPAIVRYITENPDVTEDQLATEFVGVSREALERARGYANEELHVDEVIAKPTEAAEQVTADEEVEDEAENVRRGHARQLLRYLERTREIADPGRDIIYLESPGAAFDLPADLAEALERYAVDGQTDSVAETFGQLEEADQRHALRLLAWLIRAAVGIERRNVARSLFRALAVFEGDLIPVAADILNALVYYNADDDLQPEDLPGALVLALADDGAAASQMRKVVLAREEVADDDDLALLVLGRQSELREHQARVAEAFAALIGRATGEEAEKALRGSAESDVINLIKPLVLDSATAVTGAIDFLDSARAHGRDQVALSAFTKLVATDGEPAAEAAAKRVAHFAPVSDRSLASGVVNRLRSRPVSEWPAWLAALDVDVAQSLENMGPLLDQYVGLLWRHRFSPEAGETAASADEFTAAARELARLRPEREEEQPPSPDLLAEGTVATDPAQVEERHAQYEALDELAEVGALAAEAAADAILGDLGRTLAAPQPRVAQPQMAEFVLRGLPLALHSAGEDVVRSFAQAAEDSSWLPEIPRHAIRVRSACALRRLSATDAAVAQDSLDALVADDSAAATDALAEWVGTFTPSAVDVYRVLEPRLRDGARLRDPLRRIVASASASWSADEKADLLETIAEPYVDELIDDSVVRGFGLSEADDDRAGSVLIAQYGAASNNDDRDRVLDLWSLVNPASEGVRRKLLDEVYIPLLGQGKNATRIALKHFNLVRDPPSDAAKERLKRAIRGAAEGEKELAKRANSLLKDVGWVSTKRKWLPW